MRAPRAAPRGDPLASAHADLPSTRQAGVDEAGCGSLIGSLIAAAVILPEECEYAAQLRDSKKLSPRVRAALASQIHETADVGVGRVSCAEIDARGLGGARREVFLRALRGLSAPPGAVVVDGTGFFDGYGDAPFRLVPRADDAYAHVAAASIVAKDFRDTLVRRTCEASPGTARIYGWAQNKGYPSAQHRAAILAHGRTTVHRASFAPCARAPPAAHVCAVTASDV